MTTLVFEGKTIHAEDGETVLSALTREGISISSGCKAGACQSCFLRSDDPLPASSQTGLDEYLVERGAFMACQAPVGSVSQAERLGNEAIPRFAASIVRTQHLSDDVLLVELESAHFHGTPGRFIRLIHPSGVVRPYSLATPAVNPESQVILHVRIIPGGLMSEILLDARPGDKFELEGPFGKCVYRTNSGEEPMVFIGSGTGLAPLYAIATDAIKHGHRGPLWIYHGAATSDRLYFRDELNELASENPLVSHIACSDAEIAEGDREGSPLINALADHPNLEGHRVYLCGHPALVRLGQKKCFLAGASLKDISADPFVAA